MASKGSSNFGATITEIMAAGPYLENEITFTAGQIEHKSDWKPGAGPGDREVAKGLYQKLTGTGATVINLANFTSPSGKTAQAMTHVRAIYIKSNATTGAPSAEIGGGTTPVAIFKDVSDIAILPAGGIFVWELKFGPGLALGSNANLKIDLGATAQEVEVIVLGY